MEPAIPVGSLSYIQETAPEDMKEKDVIAYYGGSDRTAIITHRPDRPGGGAAGDLGGAGAPEERVNG